jgi:predicted negative regulator of RcsB-dependent stress response
MPRTLPGQVLRFIATVAVSVLLGAHSPAAAPQKPAPPPPTAQAQLEARVKDLETRLVAAEQKAASAAMEKDYITRVQAQYERYYEKAFNTQVTILSVIALFITIIFGIAARFGFTIFDRSIQHALSDASSQLRTEFAQMLAKETQALREANAAQVERLQENLLARAEFTFQFSQGMSQSAGKDFDEAIKHYLNALQVYTERNLQQTMGKEPGAKSIANIFANLKAKDPANFEVNARKELAANRYKNLPDELAFAAVDMPELGPLLREGKLAPFPPSVAQPKT